MKITCRRSAVLLAPLALLATSSLVHADSNANDTVSSTTDESTLDQDHGYYVSSNESKERGGGSGYVPRQKELRGNPPVAPAPPSQPQACNQCPPQQNAGTAATTGNAEVQRLLTKLHGELLFDTGSSDLTQQGSADLALLGKELQKLPDQKVRIEGYTDDVGSMASNDQLAQERIDSVTTVLTNNGATKTQISSLALGMKNPVASNSTDQGRALNRRVEIHPMV